MQICQIVKILLISFKKVFKVAIETYLLMIKYQTLEFFNLSKKFCNHLMKMFLLVLFFLKIETLEKEYLSE